MKVHGLPHMIIFRIKNGFCAVSLVTLQKKELVKLLIKTGSENINHFLKYRHSLLELDKSIPGAQEKNLVRPIRIMINEDAIERHCSRGHYEFFKMLCDVPVIRLLHGIRDVKLCYTVENA
jgi:hypothetical protein